VRTTAAIPNPLPVGLAPVGLAPVGLAPVELALVGLALVLLMAGCPPPGAVPPVPGQVEVQGHRGCRGLLPENTMAAFRRAIRLGVDVLELDVGSGCRQTGCWWWPTIRASTPPSAAASRPCPHVCCGT
jgi:hypothetical protein